jgi:hypothetical protein
MRLCFLVDRKPYRTRIMAAVAFMLLLGAGACSYTFAQAPVDRMDQIVRSYSDNHQFMGSVLVVQGDKIVFEDTELGIQAATAAGMASVRVPSPMERMVSL